MHACPWENINMISPTFSLTKRKQFFEDIDDEDVFDNEFEDNNKDKNNDGDGRDNNSGSGSSL